MKLKTRLLPPDLSQVSIPQNAMQEQVIFTYKQTLFKKFFVFLEFHSGNIISHSTFDNSGTNPCTYITTGTNSGSHNTSTNSSTYNTVTRYPTPNNSRSNYSGSNPCTYRSTYDYQTRYN